MPYFVLSRVRAYRTVSPAVDARFLKILTERFGESRALRVHSTVRCSQTPYVEPVLEEVDFTRKERVILSGSRFTSRKNVVLIAQALARALPQLPGWRAWVFGRGEDEPAISALLDSLVRAGRVEIGYEAKMDERMRLSKIYVSMIQPDNYPSQSVLEAMQRGNALLLSNTGESSRFLSAKPNGEIVELDAESLSEAIVRLASDERIVAELGQESMRYANHAFAAREHVGELIALYANREDGASS